jgi:hypothetical protein
MGDAEKMGDVIPFREEAFEPDVIAAMSAALEKACLAVDCQDQTNVVREIVAKRIIEAAKQGHTDADVLYEHALKSFGIDVDRMDAENFRVRVAGG